MKEEGFNPNAVITDQVIYAGLIEKLHPQSK